MPVLNPLGGALVLCAVASAVGLAAAAEPVSAADCFKAGFESGNADAVAACYAQDAVIWFPGGPMAQGRQAIRDGFAGYFAHATVKKAELMPMGTETVGDLRVSWGTYAMTLVDKATQAESVERGRYTDVSKLIGGRWLYVVDHPSDDPAPVAK